MRNFQTKDFKSAITLAKDFAVNLPGGDLLIEEQDAVISLLETLKERKRSVYLAYNICYRPTSFPVPNCPNFLREMSFLRLRRSTCRWRLIQWHQPHSTVTSD